MLTSDRLRQLVYYDPKAGTFTRRVKTSANIGDIAGYINNRGYVQMYVDGGRYQAHRLAWLYMFGLFPAVGIDHINKNKSDNSIDNLRLADASVNGRNQKLSSLSTSGCTGVTFHKHIGKWQSYLKIRGHSIYLGSHVQWWDAVCARKSANNEHKFSERHGEPAPLHEARPLSDSSDDSGA